MLGGISPQKMTVGDDAHIVPHTRTLKHADEKLPLQEILFGAAL